MKIRSLLLISILPLIFSQCQHKTAPAASGISEPLFHKWAPTPPMGWNSWDCYGPTVVESEVNDRPGTADFSRNNVNMWRTADDFWDNWLALKNQFNVLESWAGLGGQGCYPDGDMLPLGRKLGIFADSFSWKINRHGAGIYRIH